MDPIQFYTRMQEGVQLQIRALEEQRNANSLINNSRRAELQQQLAQIEQDRNELISFMSAPRPNESEDDHIGRENLRRYITHVVDPLRAVPPLPEQRRKTLVNNITDFYIEGARYSGSEEAIGDMLHRHLLATRLSSNVAASMRDALNHFESLTDGEIDMLLGTTNDAQFISIFRQFMRLISDRNFPTLSLERGMHNFMEETDYPYGENVPNSEPVITNVFQHLYELHSRMRM